MTSEEILANAPDEAEYTDGYGGYYAIVVLMVDGVKSFRMCELIDGIWNSDIEGLPLRSLSDIRRIVELERQLEGNL